MVAVGWQQKAHTQVSNNIAHHSSIGPELRILIAIVFALIGCWSFLGRSRALLMESALRGILLIAIGTVLCSCRFHIVS